MKITKHAQSCFLLETAQSRVLIDAGSYVFGDEGLSAADFKNIDLLIFTHEHADHFDLDNVSQIISESHQQVFGTEAVAEQLDGIAEVELLTDGFRRTVKDVTVEAYLSTHGPLPTGAEPPTVMGVVVDDGKTRFYTPGDTIVLDDRSHATVVAVPICGQVVLNIEQARTEVLRLKPDLAIPIHYDNSRFPVEVADFEKIMAGEPVKEKTLDWGESVEV